MTVPERSPLGTCVVCYVPALMIVHMSLYHPVNIVVTSTRQAVA